MNPGDLSKLESIPEGKDLVVFLKSVLSEPLAASTSIEMAKNVGQHDFAVEILEYIEGNKNE